MRELIVSEESSQGPGRLTRTKEPAVCVESRRKVRLKSMEQYQSTEAESTIVDGIRGSEGSYKGVSWRSKRQFKTGEEWRKD
jgi:hypothetical protein